MPRRRKNRNGRNGSIASVGGLIYLGKHIGNVVLKRNSLGQLVYEIQGGNIGKASEILQKNFEEFDMGSLIVDGFKLGILRRLGLSTQIAQIGKTRIKTI